MSDRSDTGPASNPDGRREAAWDAYWRHGGASGHALAESSKAEMLDQFWGGALTGALAEGGALGFAADLGCGSGAVAALLARHAIAAGCVPERLLCVDWSPVAARAAADRLAIEAGGVAADLAALPIADGVLKLVVSQYGLEYAGMPAFRETVRVLAPGGRLIALVHDSSGGVAAECRGTQELFDKVHDTKVVSLAKPAFGAGFKKDRAAFAEAAQRLRPAMVQFEELIAVDNDTTAMQFLRHVHRDIGVMFARLQAYAPQDVFTWLANVEGEIHSYRSRMRSMLEAAKSASEINDIAALLRASGCAVDDPKQVVAQPGGASIGWRLSLRKANKP